MDDRKVICCGEVNIIINIPIKHIIEMRVRVRENEHSVLWIKAIIQNDYSESVSVNRHIGEKVSLILEKDSDTLFQGEIVKINSIWDGSYNEMEIWSYSATIQLDKDKKKRSFQNINMSYEQVIQEVIKNKEAKFIWNELKGQKIFNPIIQYEETDWEFCKRLASHFHTVIYPDGISGKPRFYFGMNKGREHNIIDLEILQYGYSNDYYTNGVYAAGLPKSRARYMKCSSEKKMRIGDYITYQNRIYIITRMDIFYKDGKITFSYLFCQDGLYQQKIYNSAICGIHLNGTVIKTDRENVFIQLDINKEEDNLYGWPFVPLNGNLCYCMPEKGSRVMLYLPSCDEGEGVAVHVQNNGTMTRNIQEREFSTNQGKKICMFPEYIEFSTKIGKMSISDSNGIKFSCSNDISMISKQNIWIWGKNIKISAPIEIMCRTPNSNINLCRDINLYAYSGVINQGNGIGQRRNTACPSIGEEETGGQWKASIAAIAAIPMIDIAQSNHDSTVDLKACGSIAKFAEGSVIISMQEVMEGKKESETSFPYAFGLIQASVVKGGYAVSNINTR